MQRRQDEPEGRGDWTERREGPGGIAIVLIALVILVAIFVLQNTDEADVDLLFWSAAVPVWAAIAIAAVVGFVAGWVASRIRARRRARR
jgi:uncharacterized integral membrane protein